MQDTSTGESETIDVEEIAVRLCLDRDEVQSKVCPSPPCSHRKNDRDKYESDLSLLARVRDSYLRQANASGWVRLDATRAPDAIAADVWNVVGADLKVGPSARH